MTIEATTKRRQGTLRQVLVLVAACAFHSSAYAQFAQQGPKLVGTGALGPGGQGSSVALSADGNTALVGGNVDNANGQLAGDGAAWVWTRSGGVWTQQAKLADPAAVGTIADQGFSVALSADGNTAIVGAPTDIGSARVWVRSGTSWSLQAKFVGTGTTGSIEIQGVSVALSADGDTAIIGGSFDNGGSFSSFGVGAAWVFTRSGGVWSQQGPKLVGSGAVGASDQGISVALSADGNTALVGGDLDNGGPGGPGAVWVWTRSGGVWTQQGPKLTGTPVAGVGAFGSSVALSSDGNTAVIGAHDFSGGVGALFPFTRSGGVWTQQSSPLFGGDFAGPSHQGISNALSGDGNTAILGGSGDAGGTGVAWIFTRTGSAWSQQGTKMVGSGAVGHAGQAWRVAISTDGLTAVVGGPADNSQAGAAWVFIATVPAVTRQPANVGACAGNSVTFSAAGASWPAATVKWQVSTNGGATFNDIPGETFTLLTFTAAIPLSGNQYRAVFANSLGTTLSGAGTLTVGTAPVITLNPVNQIVTTGSSVTFTAGATGTPIPTVQWFASHDGGVTFTAVPGATSTTLSFTATPDLNGALYAAQFSTPCQTLFTAFASLNVSAPPTPPIVTTQPASIAVCPGQGGALTQFLQQGTRLKGTGVSGGANQGQAVAISADGNTVIVGGVNDSSGTGAVWVFTRAGDVFTQQSPKLVGTGTGTVQGASVAVSADGNTVLVGGWGSLGGAWVWTRSGGAWTQQGPQLSGAGGVPNTQFGYSVALSADGNTAAVGGNFDNGTVGAVWLFTRGAGVWTQEGPKLVGAGAVGNATQGTSIALSADGNTLLVGGINDNGGAGAVWVWTRSGGVWTQQGPKLVGTGSSGNANQGIRVALSSDGNTAAVGDFNDASPGGMWVWTRSGGVWTQQGPKLVGTGAVGNAHEGASVALSGDGNTALCGGFLDSGSIGAAWVFTRTLGVWSQQGAKLVGTGSQFPSVFPPQQGTSVALSTDGSTAIVGGIGDFLNGAAWVFAKNQASFTAAASGAPTPTVQWQVSTDGGATFQDIPGATSNGLAVTAAAASNGNQYRAVFTNTGGGATSNAVAFTVNTPPTVTANPLNQTRTSGQTAAFTAAASGSPVPTVQWQVSAQGIGPFIDIAGASSSTLSFTVTQAMIGNRYRAVFTDGCGAAITAAAVLSTQFQLTTTASPPAGGTVTPLSGGLYDAGTVVSLLATPNAGFAFTVWIGPVGSPSSAATTVVVNGPMTVTAIFAPIGSAGLFYPLPPCRVLDTRNPAGPLGAPPLQQRATRTFDVSASPCGIPADAVAISANLTVTNVGAPGELVVFPADVLRPNTSALSFRAARTRANNAIVKFSSSNATFSVFNNSPATVDFIVDVNGYFR